MAARSLAAAGDEVTLPQYRALVVLAAQGPQGTAELAAALAVNPSTATRMCDRLVRKGLVRQHPADPGRRALRLGRAVAAVHIEDRPLDEADLVAGQVANRRGACEDENASGSPRTAKKSASASTCQSDRSRPGDPANTAANRAGIRN